MSTPGVVEVRQPAAEGDNSHDIEYHEVRPGRASPAPLIRRLVIV